MRMTTSFFIVAILIAAGAARPVTAAPDSLPLKSDLASRSVGGWGVDLSDRDVSIKAGDDFYLSQNGAWLARTLLTPEAPFAAYWADLRKLAPRRVAAILEDVAADKNRPPDTIDGKAGAFYRAFIDTRTIEARGLTPLGPELNALRAVRTKAAMAKSMGHQAGPGTQPAMKKFLLPPDRSFFSVAIAQDKQDPGHYAVYLGQGGLGLPGPEYYLDPHLADIKTAYESYAARMLGLIGWPEPQTRAREIVELESRIAAVSWSHEQMLDALKTYNKMSIAELRRLAPGFDWRAFLEGAEIEDVRTVVVDARSTFPAIAHIFAETPLSVLRARQAFILIDDSAPLLSEQAVLANFEFRNRVFNNKSAAQRPRPIQAYFTLEMNIGDILGSLYVQHYFSKESRSYALEMAENMRRALDARLQNNPWMSPATRTRAREKLARMKMNIGYSDKLQDFAGLEIKDDDLYGDVVRATAYSWRRNVRRLYRPFDRNDWATTPQTVTYNYNASTNTVEIPAASLQPPFFDLKADPAVNYGSIGAVIGSMIASAFDSQGRHYDADGRLNEWMTADESKKAGALTAQVAAQYSAVEPLPGLHVKGALVADEAIDDIGGLLIALDGYHLSLMSQPAPVLDGFTGDQRVFLGRAQMWRAKFDEAFIRTLLATGRNAQPFIRVNGPVRNIDAWYDAFNVESSQKLYLQPDARVRFW